MASLSLIALALCALAAVAALWRRPRPLPPGGRHPPVAGGGHWLVGHLLQLSDLQHHIFVRDVVNKHGPVVKLVLPGLGYQVRVGSRRSRSDASGGAPTPPRRRPWVRCDNSGVAPTRPARQLPTADGPRKPPGCLQTVLADGAAARAALASFPKPWVPYGVSRALSDTFSAGTFSTLGLSPHDLWKRKHTRGSFSLTAVRRGVPGMLRHADRLAAFWAAAASAAPLHPTHPGAVCVDVQATFAALVLDIFGETGLAGYRFGAVDGDGPGVVLLRDLPPAFEEVLMKSPLFWRRLLPAWCSPGRAAALRCVGTTSDVFRDVLRHGRALPPDALEGTLLESLLGLIEAGATEGELCSEVNMFTVAGHGAGWRSGEQPGLQAPPAFLERVSPLTPFFLWRRHHRALARLGAALPGDAPGGAGGTAG